MKVDPGAVFFHMTINLLRGSRTGQAALLESRFEQMCHPSYSHDLAPSDYRLFPNLKKHPRGLRFLTADELKYATEE